MTQPPRDPVGVSTAAAIRTSRHDLPGGGITAVPDTDGRAALESQPFSSWLRIHMKHVLQSDGFERLTVRLKPE